MNEEDLSLEVPLWVYPLGVVTQLFTLLAAGYVYVGTLVTAPLIVAGTLALVMWLATSYRHPRKRRILPLYLALVIVLMLQGFEQWHFGYAEVVKGLFPASFEPPVVFNEAVQMSVLTLATTTLFLVAAVGIFFHHQLGNYIGWFVMAHAVVQGLCLLGIPMVAGRMQYVPGMASALLAIPLGVLGAARLSRASEIRGALS